MSTAAPRPLPEPVRDRALRLAARSLALVAGAVTVLVFAYVLRQSSPLLSRVGPLPFLRDREWAPTAGRYGLLPMLAGTLWTTLGAVALAAPVGVAYAAAAVFYAPPRAGRALSGLMALLAGIPSVVYGLWGLVTLAPWMMRVRPPGLCVATGVLVLAVMILPTVATMAEAAFRQVPRGYTEAAQALGLGRWATLRHVALPAARGGVLTGVILAVGRAVGETMALIMVLGNTVQFPRGPFDSARTLTATIALEMSYARTDHRAALFATGLVLLVLVAALTLLADRVAAKGAARRG